MTGNEFYWTARNTRFHGIQWVPEQYSHVMIIVHGIGEHIGRYDAVAAYFADKGYAVTGIDHYGHGGTDGLRGATRGLDFTMDYLNDFLWHVQDLYNKPVVMYGHSMGGGMLTGFLLRKQPNIEAAVISAPALIVARRPGPLLRAFLRVAATILPNLRISQGLDITKISHDVQQVEKFRADPQRHDRMSLRLANDMIVNGLWCLHHAKNLQVPSLLIHGSADELTAVEGSRLFAERAPQNLITYKEWPGDYHELHNEVNSKDVLFYINKWLTHHLEL
ncbi:Lysophospholipase, alpha-beta hydrolase superfamily [Chitinophaga jiangningensis]|uniref:Lysophospholipase, alpha-beta hydrolase superfamily n=1 Tax=Chitinophaga jiangningensis TaxID=1419482 RepID=A0A1M7BSR0_9BACT|nr:alpha/beta hydrolase [Chitinophaga jiangningensis]SHL57589.1 Lysophospholipase, alpha-beta hydrolase superfamily [Chitinophaga jiangningensis]